MEVFFLSFLDGKFLLLSFFHTIEAYDVHDDDEVQILSFLDGKFLASSQRIEAYDVHDDDARDDDEAYDSSFF